MEAFEQLKQIVDQPQPSTYLEEGYSLEITEYKSLHVGVKLKKNGKIILSHHGFDIEESKKRIVEHLLITGICALNKEPINDNPTLKEAGFASRMIRGLKYYEEDIGCTINLSTKLKSITNFNVYKLYRLGGVGHKSISEIERICDKHGVLLRNEYEPEK
tara:strand:+ start:656 stop:1135 length:480 start_codon:yes stop_codon:yes gene_type:complete